MSNQATIRFVILAAPRSGSNMLCSMLNSHHSILCHHELYNPADIFYALQLRDSDFKLAVNMEQRDRQPLSFLARVWRYNQSKSCVGFKMTHKQNPQVFDALLADTSIKKIVLKRNNTVKVHVSKLIAEQNGIWEDYGQHAPTKHNQVEVDLSSLQADVAFNLAFYQEIIISLNQSKQNYIVVEYEKLTTQLTQNTILDFLKLQHQALTTMSCKQNSTDLRQLVSNFSTLFEQCQDKSLKAQLTDRCS
ncbi:MAG: hypothetical protein JKY19_10120 [Alcanivoracaceae bacterium]|nr:hypothetical protein [Alcanivoracaceae bacterium]